MRSKSGVAVLFGVAGGALAVPAIVMACTGLTYSPFMAVGPVQAPAGTVVTIRGDSFASGTAPIDIRWNSEDGPLLASKVGPSFSNVPITIPQVPDNDYVILGLQMVPGHDGMLMKVKAVVPFSVRTAVAQAAPQAITPYNAAAPRPGAGSTTRGLNDGGVSANARGPNVIFINGGTLPSGVKTGADGNANGGPPTGLDSVSGDLWSGFHYSGHDTPSLGSPGNPGGQNSPFASWMFAGAGMAVVVTLLGVVTIASLSRRKARAFYPS